MHSEQIKAIWGALDKRYPECGEVINYICNACEDTALLNLLGRERLAEALANGLERLSNVEVA